jgi:probable selenium-dependent hydroxylase accessory protein YqeC
MSQTTLASALGVAAGEVVAFVGAGGKTTAMFRLADEIAATGGRVVTTTTTRLAASEAARAQVHVCTPAALPAALASARHVLFTGGLDADADKALGVDPAALCALRLSGVTLLVEADGSRRLPFKAPADHEPVVPACATLVVWVVGVDAVGAPLDADHVHRPALVARIHPGATVTPEMIAAVAVHPQGGCKNVPQGARVAVLVNKVDDDVRLDRAREIAARLPAGGGIARVALVALERRARRPT